LPISFNKVDIPAPANLLQLLARSQGESGGVGRSDDDEEVTGSLFGGQAFRIFCLWRCASMPPPVQLQAVAQRLHAMYEITSQESHKEAAKWLEIFESTEEAWQICEQLIDSAAPPYAIIWACTALKNKIGQRPLIPS
jgi:hypothetical protein